MLKTVDKIYAKWDEPQLSCLLALRSIIREQDSGITETVKYGLPCFCYNDRHFCYLGINLRNMHPYLLMVDGNKLNHPLLDQGNRKRMKVFEVDPNDDIPIETVQEILEEGLTLRKQK